MSASPTQDPWKIKHYTKLSRTNFSTSHSSSALQFVTYQKLCWQQILKSLLLQNKPINKTKWPILSKYIKIPKYTHKVHTQLLHSCNALQGITVAQKGGLFSKWQQGLGNYVYPSLRLLANLQIQMWHPQKRHIHCIYSDLTLYLTIKTINTIFILQGIVDETS